MRGFLRARRWCNLGNTDLKGDIAVFEDREGFHEVKKI